MTGSLVALVVLSAMGIGLFFSAAIYFTVVLRREGGGIDPVIAFGIWWFCSVAVAVTILIARVVTLGG